MGAVAQRAEAQVVMVRPAVARRPAWTWSRDDLKHAGANFALAFMFFATALSPARLHDTSLVNLIWIAGALVMGVFSLVRNAPLTSMVDARSLASSGATLVLPCLMLPAGATTVTLAAAALALELAGVILSQAARICMGRSFGILPANRGIVSDGPFAVVRHPIYLGWALLSLGFVFAFPSARNMILLAVSLPFLAWRIKLEEELLRADPEYRAYCERVRFRLCPGLY
jgi:protein-S-isoprenylcysteine O-methyltransferase Ste14